MQTYFHVGYNPDVCVWVQKGWKSWTAANQIQDWNKKTVSGEKTGLSGGVGAGTRAMTPATGWSGAGTAPCWGPPPRRSRPVTQKYGNIRDGWRVQTAWDNKNTLNNTQPFINIPSPHARGASAPHRRWRRHSTGRRKSTRGRAKTLGKNSWSSDLLPINLTWEQKRNHRMLKMILQ